MLHTLGSSIRLSGVLTIHVRDARTKRILRTLTKQNTITFDGGNIVRGLLAQRATDPDPSTYRFGSMRFGTSSTAPTRYDTNLISEVNTIRKQLTDLKKVNGITGELLLQATLEDTEGNGNILREAGLFTCGSGAWDADVGGDLLMYSRQLHTAIEKSAIISLDFNWKLQFTV